MLELDTQLVVELDDCYGGDDGEVGWDWIKRENDAELMADILG